jgi:hypothetical protein
MSWAQKGHLLTVYVCTITKCWKPKTAGDRSETFTFAATTGIAVRQHLLPKLCDLWKEENPRKELPESTTDSLDRIWEEMRKWYSWTIMELAVYTQEKVGYSSDRELLEYLKRELRPA